MSWAMFHLHRLIGEQLGVRLREHDILVKPLNDARLSTGFMRVTTALPEDNVRFIAALRALL